MADARFMDAGGGPLRLWATDAEDLQIVSALCQDAVLTAADMTWRPRDRRLALLINRFRWETRAARPERVRAILSVQEVEAVRGQGVTPGDSDSVLSLLSVEWAPGGDADGALRLTFAGDGVVEARCTCLDLTLSDVTAPYAAPSGKVPGHDR